MAKISRIGLISDTHLPEYHQVVPEQVEQIFQGMDMILHAGDIYDTSCLDWLEQIAPTLAARGNGDFFRSIEDRRIRDAQVVEVQGLRIGVTHDLPLPEAPPYRTLEQIMEREFSGPVDIIVHGHTHVEDIDSLKGVYLVNPGSPTLPHNLTHILGTVAVLEIADGVPRAEVIKVDDFRVLDLTSGEKWFTVR